jgi:hypothetical protein
MLTHCAVTVHFAILSNLNNAPLLTPWDGPLELIYVSIKVVIVSIIVN